MKLADVARHLGASVLTGHGGLDGEARGAFAADLLSDVLNRGAPHVVLLTGLTNLQVVRTAEIMDLAGIVFVRNKQVSPEVVAMGAEKGLVMMATHRSLYETCGLLYVAGLPAVSPDADAGIT
ncbi:MAG TPA: DRTGG domain-containing protein [Bacillota bacterium]|nr:DRTGG domain-containing protein [Bacillota bacterium]